MAANKNRKKKRISKHVLKSKATKTGKDAAVDSSVPDLSGPPVKQAATKKINSTKVKDPTKAASYLSAWKHREAGGGAWKFNKNTQSWLIRHMYDVDKVAKTTFDILLDYLDGMPEGTTKARIIQDAQRRALRYKEYEKQQEAKEDSKEGQDEQENTEMETVEGMDDETRWKLMNDHEKRKVYKRTRKILEVLQEPP